MRFEQKRLNHMNTLTRIDNRSDVQHENTVSAIKSKKKTFMRLTNNITHHFQQFQAFAMNRMVSPAVLEKDSLSYWRVRILFTIIFSGLLISLFVFLPLIAMVIEQNLWTLLAFDVAAWLIGLSLLLASRPRYELRATITLFMFYIVGLVIIISVGPLSGGPAFIFAFAVLVGVLLGSKAAIKALILNALTLTIIGWTINAGIFDQTFPFFNSIKYMITAGASFMFLNIVAAMSVAVLVKGLNLAHQKEKNLAVNLKREQLRLIKIKNELESEVEERKHTTEALTDSEATLKSIFRAAPTGIGMVSNRILDQVNERLCEMVGYLPEELVGKSARILYPNEDEFQWVGEEKYKQIRESGTGTVETRWQCKDGSIIDVLLSSTPIDTDKSTEGVTFTALDITDRKQAEGALRRSNERFRILFDSAPDAIYIHRMDGTFLDGNKAAEKLLGYKKEELIGENLFEIGLLSGQDLPKALNALEQSQKGNLFGPDEFTLYRKDMTPVCVEILTHPVEIKDERLVLGIARDVTDRKQAEEAMRLSEEKFSKAFQTSPVWVAITTISEDRFLEVNDTFTKISGFTRKEAIGRTSLDLGFWRDPENGRERALRAFYKQGYFRNLEMQMRFKDGIEHTMLWSADPIDFEGQECFINVLTDITEHKMIQKEKANLESQLQQAQKMEAIGTLAGGIAHDFNNILGAIIGYTELSLNEAEKDSILYQNLQEVFKASGRAKDLVQQILTFSRQAERERKPVQVKLICKEAIKFLRASLPTSIKIRQKIDSDFLVKADPTQIHQVLMNLCTNAGHAMREKGGVLEVKLTNVKLDEDLSAKFPDLKPGPYIELAVSDTGHGIPAHIIDRIFDPFFTTKENGEGTGMGLSVVHGIVGGCGGEITASSEPSKGATFKIYLPAMKRDNAQAPITEDSIATGTERILFVDDEKALVDLGKRMLESLGYKVTTRTSSIEALELFKAKADSFDLVITDMTMPNVTGEKLASELIRIKPDVPVILCTGYSAHIDQEQALTMGIRAFIFKPVIKGDMAKTIRRVLNAE